jgi:hypothetical protein
MDVLFVLAAGASPDAQRTVLILTVALVVCLFATAVTAQRHMPKGNVQTPDEIHTLSRKFAKSFWIAVCIMSVGALFAQPVFTMQTAVLIFAPLAFAACPWIWVHCHPVHEASKQ